MLLQPLDLLGWESSPIAYSGVAFYIAYGAHTWDHGRDCRMTQDIAQGDLWQLINGDPQIGDDVLDVLVHFLLAITSEVVTTEILRIEAAFGGNCTCETTFVEGNTHDDPDVVLLASGKEPVFGALVKYVVDDLNCIHEAGFDQSERVVRLMIVDRDPEKAKSSPAL